MLSFGIAIGKWFPNIRPQEVEYNEDDLDKKVPKPDFVKSVNNILKRYFFNKYFGSFQTNMFDMYLAKCEKS